MDGYVSYRKIMRMIAIVSVVIAVILAAVLYFLLSGYNEREQEKRAELHRLDIEKYEELKNEDIVYGDDISEADKELLEKMKNYDFYQKVEEKLDTYIGFFGTEAVRSTRSGTGGWVSAFFETMRNRYSHARGINCGSANTTSLYGYVALNIRALQSFEYFDLVVICYGAYDDPATFATYYDGFLRSVKNQNEKCEIYCMIEANAEGYNPNAETVKQICALYGGVCIDMNEYYKKYNIDYESTLNGIEPNAYGEMEYFNAIFETIDASLAAKRRVEPVNRVNFSTSRDFDNYKFVTLSNMKKISDTVYEFSSSGKMAVLMYKMSAEHGADTRVYINGKKMLSIDTRQGSTDELGVMMISTELGSMNRIRIETGTEDNAMNIYGIGLSGAK